MSKHDFAHQLCDMLVSMQSMSAPEARELQKAFEESSKANFDDFLLEEGIVSEEDLLQALSSLYKVPSIDVVGIFFDTMLLRKFPKGMLIRLGVIPYQVDENILVLVASDPSQDNLLPCLGQYVSYDLQFMVGLRRDIEDSIKEFYDKSLTEVDEDEYMRETDLDDHDAYQEEELLEQELESDLDEEEGDDNFHSEC